MSDTGSDPGAGPAVVYERSMHPRAAGSRIRVHVGLFLATVYTTTVAGSVLAGAVPESASVLYPLFALAHPDALLAGLPFSVALLSILLVHEMGHYLASRRWQVRATLPYFIPFPLMIGTLGAVIKIRSRIPNKRALLDIGASGPIAGFVMSIVALSIGLPMSGTVSLAEVGGGITLGDSILTSWLVDLLVSHPPGTEVVLHPVALAGWLGLFVTMLNMLPIGQFDGGHVVYALFGRRQHERFSRVTVLVLALFYAVGPPYDWVGALDFWDWLATRWPGWLVWIVIAIALGRRHPPPFDGFQQLGWRRKLVGAVALVIFVLCFIPRPFAISP